MAEILESKRTLTEYLDSWQARTVVEGNNPLVKMPLKRFRALTYQDLQNIENGASWLVGSLADPIARNLFKNYEDKLRERGEQTSFVTMGYVICILAGNSSLSKTTVLPVWLKQVSLEKKNNAVFATQADGTWELNPELSEVLSFLNLDFNIAPQGSTGAFLDWLSVSVGNRGQVLRESFLGCFSNQSFVLRGRMADTRWRRSVALNPLVQSKLNGTFSNTPDEPVTDAQLESLGIVLPVDDSQMRAVQMADQGFSFVIQGPPGTGKSQTIVNLMSNAFYRQKRVLLVCDKQTAIDQVEKRLVKCGLGAALINIHDEGLDKKEFLKQAVLLLPKLSTTGFDIEKLTDLRSKLNERVAMGEELVHPAFGIKRRDAVAGMVHLRDDAGAARRIDVPNWENLSKPRLTEALTAVGTWSQLKDIATISNNILNQIIPAEFRVNPNAKTELIELIAGIRCSIKDSTAVVMLAGDLGYKLPNPSPATLLAFSEFTSLVLTKPFGYELLLGNTNLSLEHVNKIEEAYLRCRELIDAGLPIESGKTVTLKDRNDAWMLLRDESCTSWRDLIDRLKLALEQLNALNVIEQGYQKLCAICSLIPQPDSGTRMSQLTMMLELQALRVSIPYLWWDQTVVDPKMAIRQWQAGMLALARHISSSPIPMDVKALDRATPSVISLLGSKVEDNFNFLSACIRMSSDRKVKAELLKLYPNIPKKGFTQWADLIQHAFLTVDLLTSVKTLSTIHPTLQDMTELYLVNAISAPRVEVNSLQVEALDKASELVNLMRTRTDIFHLTTVNWTALWATASDSIIKQLADYKAKWLSTNCYNEQLTPEMQIQELQTRISKLQQFLNYYAPAGKTDMGVLDCLDVSARLTELCALEKELDVYRFLSLELGSSWCAQEPRAPAWDDIRARLCWRENFIQKKGLSLIDITNMRWEEASVCARQWISVFEKRCRSFETFFKAKIDTWSFHATELALSQIESQLPVLSSWLIKADWSRDIVAWPELQPLWSCIITGDVKPPDANKFFCYNLLRHSVQSNLQEPEPCSIVKMFQNLDEKVEQWTIAELSNKLRERQERARNHPQLNFGELSRIAGLTSPRGKVREICNQFFDLLLELKSGWLVSPTSLANLIDLSKLDGKQPFDLVIFDEASQVRVSEGLLAMGFAKQTIIVGDSMQLPPSSFFVTEDPEDSSDVYDSESLVEEFNGVAPFIRLLSHYRSETPDLISFSNKLFYDNQLEILPPARVSGLGRALHYVKDGVFDSGKTRTNPVEASAVVDQVRLHVKMNANKSLGVVTMNLEQLDLIDQLLQKEDVRIRNFCDNKDLFFLRNLETVQGDEMDIIIVSLTYGKSANGQFSASVLGPITKKGGHRRLNVALSRSRSGMILVSSMCTSELDGCTAQSEGFKALRILLGDLELNHSVENYGISSQAFKQNVGNQYQILFCESPFEEQVFKFLDRKGYEVHCQVGSGSFRIDLVVVECGFPVIAVECDGATYHSSRSARTRDRARQRLLEQKGWVFHRIWSTNWLMCPGDEQTALLVAIENARKTLDTKQGSPVLGKKKNRATVSLSLPASVVPTPAPASVVPTPAPASVVPTPAPTPAIAVLNGSHLNKLKLGSKMEADALIGKKISWGFIKGLVLNAEPAADSQDTHIDLQLEDGLEKRYSARWMKRKFL